MISSSQFYPLPALPSQHSRAISVKHRSDRISPHSISDGSVCRRVRIPVTHSALHAVSHQLFPPDVITTQTHPTLNGNRSWHLSTARVPYSDLPHSLCSSSWFPLYPPRHSSSNASSKKLSVKHDCSHHPLSCVCKSMNVCMRVHMHEVHTHKTAFYYLSPSVPGGAVGKESACQCKRCKRLEFDPWIR